MTGQFDLRRCSIDNDEDKASHGKKRRFAGYASFDTPKPRSGAAIETSSGFLTTTKCD